MRTMTTDGVRAYHYNPGLTGDVHIENVSCDTGQPEGYKTMGDISIPGGELKALIKEGDPRPMVGVGLLVVRGGSVLLSQRKGSHGAGEYGVPGGHLENGETFEQCAYRELAEECGAHVKITTPRFLCVTNLRDYLPKHYADISMVAHWESGEPETMEPHKAGPWQWHPIDRLPDGRFSVIDNLVIAYQTGQPYFA